MGARRLRMTATVPDVLSLLPRRRYFELTSRGLAVSRSQGDERRRRNLVWAPDGRAPDVWAPGSGGAVGSAR